MTIIFIDEQPEAGGRNADAHPCDLGPQDVVAMVRRAHPPVEGMLRPAAEQPDRRVVLVAPARDEPGGQEEDDRLGDRQAQRWEEELALDPVAAASGLEDRDAELRVEGVDVPVDGACRHPGQPRDLGHRHAAVAAPRGVEDGGDTQQPRQPIALAADAVVRLRISRAGAVGQVRLAHHPRDRVALMGRW